MQPALLPSYWSPATAATNRDIHVSAEDAAVANVATSPAAPAASTQFFEIESDSAEFKRIAQLVRSTNQNKVRQAIAWRAGVWLMMKPSPRMHAHANTHTHIHTNTPTPTHSHAR